MLVLTLTLSSCGGQLQFSVPASSENFGQAVKYNDQVDILWVVDDSQTMAQHQNRLAAQFDYFMDALLSTKLNYHLGVISTDRGAYNGQLLGNPKVINLVTTNPKSVFGQNVKLGSGGSPVERGLASLDDALSPGMLSGLNSGFLRDEALLVVIFLSDENDHSTGQAADYINMLDQLKPRLPSGARGWMANFIGSLDNSPVCQSYGADAEAGVRYMDVVSASGGISESICTSDLSKALTSVRKRIVEVITQYHLAKEPFLETLQVFINGILIPQNSDNGWTYANKIVTFHGASIPTSDAVVSVNYQAKEL